MAGNRRIYEEAMRRGHNYAWDKQWDKAIAEYERAAAEFPNDIVVNTSLGMAYLETQQLDRALQAYQRVCRVAPDDVVAWARLADVQERLGRLEEAAESYVIMADLYLRQRDVKRAIETWVRATRLDPGNITAHKNLARTYATQGKVRSAVREYLALARIYERQGATDQAIAHCQQALELDPHNGEVLAVLDRLRHGERLAPPPRPRELRPEAPPPPPPPEAEEEEEKWEEEIEILAPAAPIDEAEEGNLVEIARRRAMAALAELLFEEAGEEVSVEAQSAQATGRAARQAESARLQINALIGQALDYQTRGLVEQAIDAYRRAIEAGLDNPAVHLNLGLLYQRKLQFDDAIAHLTQALRDPAYCLGAHFALGECYRATGHVDKALEHCTEALKIVDIQLTRHDQARALSQHYKSLLESYLNRGDREQTLAFVDAMMGFLGHKDWLRRVREARRCMDSLAGDGVVMSLAEMLEMPGAEDVLPIIATIQDYLKQGLFYTAMEECLWAISAVPTYLPLHLCLAEILIQEGHVDEAVKKCLTVASVYELRGEDHQAIGIYKRVLKVAPMDVAVRSRLIDLLIENDEVDQALEQLLILADAYYQLAQTEKALSTYNRALRLAPQGSPGRNWTVQILHRIGDINTQLLDWREAVAIYQQIKRLSPADEKARQSLVDLYYKLGQPRRALAELDELLELYRSKGRLPKAISFLEELLQFRPEEIPLHKRLSQVYLEVGRKEDAVAELDTLGELQLQAGQRAEAIKTIEAIIALNPDNVDAYRQLLLQMQRGRV